MIIKTEELKNICNELLPMVDSTNLSIITETLEIKVNNGILYMNITNKEYFIQVKFNIGNIEDFRATVNAELFLKLIAHLTTETVEFIIKDNFLIIKGNGNYKLPLIYEGDKLLELPPIVIHNVTTEFDMDGNNLNNILKYNSKQLQQGVITRPIQRYYYVDEKGAITFSSGACITKFTLEKPVKILLTNKIVKLFKVFRGKKVHFKLGQDPLNNEIIQTKVCFETDNVVLNAIISCDEEMLNSVPHELIRSRADKSYPYSVVFNKDYLLSCINRMLLFFNTSFNAYCAFKFEKDRLNIYNKDTQNSEFINYNNNSLNEEYECIIDLKDFKFVLESLTDSYITVNFGDGSALVVYGTGVYNVVPECTPEENE